ncbi:hypothetical protein S40288_01958 [Stachybotrys chartarum IBT 40288]|nr:hypothetical protein S40288_01958 [Stachybotrys chartarum IBT 40288]
MAALQSRLGTNLDSRVEDYLDDKFQSTTDLDTLDELLANVELQRHQLQSQLDNAVKELDEARRTADGRQGSLAARIEDFQKLQHSIDVRVQIAAASDAPSRAIARLQAPMKKLQMVELAQKYLSLLQDVEALRTEARSHLPGSPTAALEPYHKLKDLSLKLRDLSGNEALHLVDHVERVTEALWTEMKNTMSAELEAVLEKRKWPNVDTQSEMDEEWIACLEKLIDLQMPEITHSTTAVPLLPFDVMTKIFVAEFRFHFLSNKPTSKPQSIVTHCFPWFISTIEKWEGFFRDNLSHLLGYKFVDSAAADKTVYVDPVCALITSMLPVLREKVHAVAQDAIANPSFLSGFISNLLIFDDTIRSRFGYDGGDAENGWDGLAAGVLQEHFDSWFQAERKFALERFETIMESQDARKIDYDYAAPGRMKPTFAAVRITDLLRSVTTQYERLRKFKHKIRFLIDIQVDILDAYHDRLRGSLEAYQAITSTIGRTLHGVTKEQQVALEGTGALETLCKVVGSADHVSNTLSEWSDEEFFSSLWDELQARDTQRSRQDKVTNTMNYDDLRSRTSNATGDAEHDGALFDETVAAYRMRRRAAEELLVAALAESHSKAFRAYLSHVQWTTIGESAVLDDPAQLSITPELDEPLHILKRNLDFLSKTLSTASFRRVWREVLDKLQDILWNGVLLRQSFTTLGATQFFHDGSAVFALIDRYIPGGSSTLGALRDGMRLLNLPAEVEGDGVTLKEASDRAFKDNDEARSLLEELGIGFLTATTARQVLQRRVENNENIGW